MNRRSFVKSTVTGLAALCIAGSTTVLTGCSVNVKALLNVVISAVNAILRVASSAPWASQLAAALTALQQAAAGWTSGSPTALVIDALNTLEAVIAAIPLTATYSPLLDVLVSGIEAILGLVTASAPVMESRMKYSKNQHHGRIRLNATNWKHATPELAFKHQWNEIAVGVGLPTAKI